MIIPGNTSNKPPSPGSSEYPGRPPSFLVEEIAFLTTFTSFRFLLLDYFALFFCDQICKIRDTFLACDSSTDAPTLAHPAFNAFDPISENVVCKVSVTGPLYHAYWTLCLHSSLRVLSFCHP